MIKQQWQPYPLVGPNHKLIGRMEKKRLVYQREKAPDFSHLKPGDSATFRFSRPSEDRWHQDDRLIFRNGLTITDTEDGLQITSPEGEVITDAKGFIQPDSARDTFYVEWWRRGSTKQGWRQYFPEEGGTTITGVEFGGKERGPTITVLPDGSLARPEYHSRHGGTLVIDGTKAIAPLVPLEWLLAEPKT